MDEPERTDVFVNNLLLGTDALTSWVAAGDDDKPPRRQRSGCAGALLVVIGVALLVAYAACQ